jgi:glycosyltransferase involved in cell wall biosynthesis
LSLFNPPAVEDHQLDHSTTLGEDSMTFDDVWVVVPMYNEASAIGSVVSELRSTFKQVLCVDDGSTDASAQAAEAAGATVLRHAVNLGQGAALQTGFEFVATHPEARWVVTFDADGQHLVHDAVRMVNVGRSGDLDLVLASRFTGSANIPFIRRLVLKGAVRFTRWSSKLDVTDAHNGLRVVNARSLGLLRLTQPRMAHASELLDLVGRHGLRFAEVPVTIVYTDYSRAKSQGNINSVNIVFDLALARLRAHS